MNKVFLTTLTALSLVGTSTMAAAAPVAPVSAAVQPASENVRGDSQLAGGPSYIIIILAIAAIGLGVAAAASGGTKPRSP